MVNKRVRCPYCLSLQTKKKGKQSGRQRYGCNDCGKRFQTKQRETGLVNKLWEEYTHQKQTLTELSNKYKKSHVWVRTRLDQVKTSIPNIQPQKTVIVADTTFWGRHYGVCVFRSWNLRRNIWWGEVETEKVSHYHYARKLLEERGWTFIAAVVDGRRGLATVFKDIPVQICQFHQLKTVTKYLTRKPKTEAGKELRKLALTLTKTNEEDFAKALTIWEEKYHNFYTEKTYVTCTNHWYYTHKNVRSAYMSLKRNLPNLFTYQKYPELNIPNTTNTIDGYFASLKKKIAQHHGLRRDRRLRVISELLNRS
ncbi:MAG: IS1 family transposase [Candidatus Nomurabacteria bacterium]|nr:MAG: IS1 family transposase [Candidatus Nomurabacteria bacterium]